MLVATIIPIQLLLMQEQKILQDRRKISFTLHDRLQDNIINNNDPFEEYSELNNKSVLFLFSNENGLMKGCASWENVKQKQETICFYGYKEK